MKNHAMLYDDYIKIRNAKKGEKVIISTGEEFTGTGDKTIDIGGKKSTKNMNLDFYDHTFY